MDYKAQLWIFFLAIKYNMLYLIEMDAIYKEVENVENIDIKKVYEVLMNIIGEKYNVDIKTYVTKKENLEVS